LFLVKTFADTVILVRASLLGGLERIVLHFCILSGGMDFPRDNIRGRDRQLIDWEHRLNLGILGLLYNLDGASALLQEEGSDGEKGGEPEDTVARENIDNKSNEHEGADLVTDGEPQQRIGYIGCQQEYCTCSY
jgi:hypothetical protein